MTFFYPVFKSDYQKIGSFNSLLDYKDSLFSNRKLSAIWKIISPYNRQFSSKFQANRHFYITVTFIAVVFANWFMPPATDLHDASFSNKTGNMIILFHT